MIEVNAVVDLNYLFWINTQNLLGGTYFLPFDLAV